MKIDWAQAKAKLTLLTEEERRIVDMLVSKKTMQEIGEALGQHRSRIWRKVEKIKIRARLA